MTSLRSHVPPTLRPFDPPTLRPCGRSAAFTLIEVMVATAVMAIMVVMIGGLFQQASSSWDAGYIRAEGGMAVRAVVGALTRDAATAVDGRRFGLSKPIEVESNKIKMWRLAPGAIGNNRDIVQVVYTGGSDVKRNGQTIYSAPDGQSSNGARFTFSAGPDASGEQYSAEDPRKSSRPYERKYYDSTGTKQNSDFPDEVAWTVPYVKVRCELTRSGTFSGLTVRSLGRDGVENGAGGETARDDIIVR